MTDGQKCCFAATSVVRSHLVSLPIDHSTAGQKGVTGKKRDKKAGQKGVKDKKVSGTVY
jgi:hypothetical protein